MSVSIQNSHSARDLRNDRTCSFRAPTSPSVPPEIGAHVSSRWLCAESHPTRFSRLCVKLCEFRGSWTYARRTSPGTAAPLLPGGRGGLLDHGLRPAHLLRCPGEVGGERLDDRVARSPRLVLAQTELPAVDRHDRVDLG